jgi:hypothetical protein
MISAFKEKKYNAFNFYRFGKACPLINLHVLSTVKKSPLCHSPNKDLENRDGPILVFFITYHVECKMQYLKKCSPRGLNDICGEKRKKEPR